MTREQADAITETGLWLHEQVIVYGPGLALAAAGITFSWACAKIRDRRERRRDLRHLEHFANHPANRTRKETP